jgi:hypothetical protein
MKQHINIRQKINANLRPPNLFSRSYGKVEEDPGSHEIDQGSTYACQTKLVKFSWVHGLNPFMNHLSNTYLRLPTKNHLFSRFFAIGLRLNVNTILLEPTDSNEDHDNGRGVSARLCWPLLLAWTAWTAWTFVSWVDRVKRPSDSPCLVLNRSKQFSFFWVLDIQLSVLHVHISEISVQKRKSPSCSQQCLPFSNHLKSSSWS